jgi:hypothetical protein
MMDDLFKDHKLKKVTGNPLKSAILYKEGLGRMESCLIIESSEGIIICGDMCPGRKGVISDFKYDFRWFSSNLSSDYLCSKFLEEVWVPEYAISCIDDLAKDPNLPDYCKKAAEFLEEFEQEKAYGKDSSVFGDPNPFYHWYTDYFDDGPEHIGYTYDPTDKALLVSIQKAFSRQYYASVYIE